MPDAKKLVQSTERSYYKDTYLYELEATIVEVGEDEGREYVIFDKTLFHPQGGGQPDDKGVFVIGEKEFLVRSLAAPANPHEEPYLVKHYFGGEDCPEIGEMGLQIIDKEARQAFSRWHSAGHLISNVLNSLYPQLDGCRGNHFPGQAFVVFNGEPVPENLTAVHERLEELVNEYIREDLSVINKWDCTPRTVQFGNFPSYPCGGTHVQKSSEIGLIKIRSVKKEKMRVSSEEKETILKVKYEVA